MQKLYNLSKKLLELRKQYKYTQHKVAAKLHKSCRAYQAYKHGINVPSLQNFINLAKLYDVSCDELLGTE